MNPHCSRAKSILFPKALHDMPCYVLSLSTRMCTHTDMDTHRDTYTNPETHRQMNRHILASSALKLHSRG